MTNQLNDLCLFAISDTQLIFGVVVGILLLWLGFRAFKGMAGMFVKLLVILLLLAVAAGIFFMLRSR